ncbi:MAG: hypothetical protein AAF995_04725 [Planctomycetota bacterium]
MSTKIITLCIVLLSLVSVSVTQGQVRGMTDTPPPEARSVGSQMFTTERFDRDDPAPVEAGRESRSAAAAFPTYWIGPVPPRPPYGYRWYLRGYDVWGRAHWDLGRC